MLVLVIEILIKDFDSMIRMHQVFYGSDELLVQKKESWNNEMEIARLFRIEKERILNFDVNLVNARQL